jgi:hypothetical protein
MAVQQKGGGTGSSDGGRMVSRTTRSTRQPEELGEEAGDLARVFRSDEVGSAAERDGIKVITALSSAWPNSNVITAYSD